MEQKSEKVFIILYPWEAFLFIYFSTFLNLVPLNLYYPKIIFTSLLIWFFVCISWNVTHNLIIILV